MAKNNKKGEKVISGVSVNLDAPDFKKVKNQKDLKKLKIFDSIDPDDQDDAENELLQELGVNQVPQTQLPTAEGGGFEHS